ncbi:MAG: radical SAM protein [Bacteroidia bacterium]|nr:radical SAM protein [Bacteroidia bacterium]
METKLFDDIIFGPLRSRRLGVSLGVNLLPSDFKLCNFDCIYCECGWTDLKKRSKSKFYSVTKVVSLLEHKLINLLEDGVELNSITFAGNGEPTLHPNFLEIINAAIALKEKYYPNAKVSVLSNSLMLHRIDVFLALQKVDNAILKLDAGSEFMFQSINKPLNARSLRWVVDQLKRFNGKCTIQTLFLKGISDGKIIDNTTDVEVGMWLELLKEINPKEVMLYSIDRPTPELHLEKVSHETLTNIANRVINSGINATVY